MLKLLPTFLLLTMICTAGQDIPAAAVKIDVNTYRLEEKGTDGKPGKVFIYRKTPFGISRFEVTPQQASSTPDNVKVTDLGDSYRFERPDLFATKTWTVKKSNLTAIERAIVDKAAAHADRAVPQKASN